LEPGDPEYGMVLLPSGSENRSRIAYPTLELTIDEEGNIIMPPLPEPTKRTPEQYEIMRKMLEMSIQAKKEGKEEMFFGCL
jgi:hypothetical protein